MNICPHVHTQTGEVGRKGGRERRERRWTEDYPRNNTYVCMYVCTHTYACTCPPHVPAHT